MNKIILAPSYQHDAISELLLNQDDIIMDTKIMPLRSYINELCPLETGYHQNIKDTLSHLKPELTILKPYLHNQTFIDAIKDFHIAMHLYNISVDELSTQTTKDQELKMIFKHLEKYIPPEITQLHMIQDFDAPFNHITLSKQHLTTDIDQAFYNTLLEKGAQQLEHPQQKAEQVKIFYATNKRAEVESVAQYLIEEELINNKTLLILLDDTYQPVVFQVLDRYQIPYSLNYQTMTPTASMLLSMVNVAMKQDYEALINFLSANPFHFKHIHSLISLVEYHKLSLDEFINYTHQEYQDELMFSGNVKHLNHISELMEHEIEEKRELLNQLEYKNNSQIVETTFNLLLELEHNPVDLASIKVKLMNNRDDIEDSDELIQLLESILNSQKDIDHPEGIRITNKNDIYYYQPQHVILLGTNAQHFPSIASKKGIIDEKYLRDTNYPEKSERFNQQLAEQQTIFNLAPSLSVFYSISSYEGKEIEPSFEIENLKTQYGIQAKRYPLVEYDTHQQRHISLNPELAQKLFLKDGALYGSVSSLEKYSSCAYAYYLQYGLKLNKNELPELGPAYIGNIFHKVIEKISHDNIKLKNLDDVAINKLVDDCFEPVLNFQNTHQNNLIKELFKSQLKTVLTHFQTIEDDHTFTHSEQEHRFTTQLNLDDKRINLLGFVDRIDFKEDYYRIVDYKSSPQTLSEKRFRQGRQLQLITYLLAMNKQLNKKPAGAYYMTLNIANTNVTNASIKYSKPFYFENDHNDYHNDIINNNRVTGWHFESPEDFYKSNEYIASINKNMSARGGTYNLGAVSEVMDAIYLNIYDSITSGIIEPRPTENPCQYCDFRSICQIKNTDFYREEIMTDIKLKGAN